MTPSVPVLQVQDGSPGTSLREAAPSATVPAPGANEAPPPSAVPEGVAVGFNAVDLAALAALPAEFGETAQPWASRLATDLAREGGRGGAARRALSRDAAISASRLRAFQAMQGLALGRNNLDRALELDKLVEREHRRLHASLDALARLEPAPGPVQIRAGTANVQVNR